MIVTSLKKFIYFIIQQLVVNVNLMAVNVIVKVIIDLISNLSNNEPIHVCVQVLGSSSPLRNPLTYISIVFSLRQWEKWFHNRTQYLGVIQHHCC